MQKMIKPSRFIITLVSFHYQAKLTECYCQPPCSNLNSRTVAVCEIQRKYVAAYYWHCNQASSKLSRKNAIPYASFAYLISPLAATFATFHFKHLTQKTKSQKSQKSQHTNQAKVASNHLQSHPVSGLFRNMSHAAEYPNNQFHRPNL